MQDVDAVDQHGKTALHWAANAGDRQRVEQLVAAGADLDARTRGTMQTSLHLAAAAGHADLVPLLVTSATLDAQDNDNKTPLQLAVQNRRLAAASALVTAGASLGGPGFVGSPLHMAVNSALLDDYSAAMALLLVDAMLARPSLAGLVAEAVRWRDDHDESLLHIAAMLGSKSLVVKLLEAGADRDAVNKRNQTPLLYAAEQGLAELVPLLATPGNINLPGGWDSSAALHAAGAADLGSEQATQALLAAGAVVDMQDASNHSPLYWPAYWGRTNVVAMLLAALKKECGPQQQQQQRQQQQVPPLPLSPQQQHMEPQGQQQQQQGRGRLVELVAAALAPLVRTRRDLCDGPAVLGVVLDALGLEVTDEVCQAVQQQLQEEFEQAWVNQHGGSAPSHQVSWLAEGLLRGWVWAEEQLHAARQPLVARLQRLVPGVGSAAQQQEVQPVQQPQEHQQVHKQLVQLVKKAALAAAAGQQQEALGLLGAYAALHLQQPQGQRYLHALEEGLRAVGKGLQETSQPPQVYTPSSPRSILQQQPKQLELLDQVIRGEVAPKLPDPAVLRAVSFHPPGVYTTFLAAWVGARRQLQQLPQEVARTVVAAVAAAGGQQQQQQVLCTLTRECGACEASAEKL
jgi:ankyrin repeat protein